ncbi:MAG: cyclic nucleotide-binding domain-containing protein [Desulfobacterales bacterium]|jgi:PAS domain S-box-containing protein
MIDEIIHNPALTKYLTSFASDQILFLEGDDSQDLYILVSGQVDIFKGEKKIREISEKGDLFGELSFFLGEKRTASVKAKDDVEVIRIPRGEIERFLREYPGAAQEITRNLAHWLAETSQIAYGLKEFCDQLPDAVVLTDKQGRVLAWNSAAENLYGRDWHQMHQTQVDEMYDDPKGYKEFLDEVQSKYSVKEKVFQIHHPSKGTRFVSTSTTILYDGHHNFQGVLSLGRDVTTVKSLERKYKRISYWLAVSFLMVGLLTAVVLIGYPYFSEGYRTMNSEHKGLRNQLAKDYYLLNSLLGDHLGDNDRQTTSQIMKHFFHIQKDASLPYTGLILLDTNKNVIDAYSIKVNLDTADMIGSSYTAIDFQGSKNSLHKVLTLYRSDKNYPMGKKGVEIAFELYEKDQILGWLIFQMDPDFLSKTHGIDAEGLKQFQFEKP